MIEAISIEKTYGLFQALKNLSFKVEKGQIVGFLGPNGAGKTTTMRILAGFYPPSSGEAIIDSYSVTRQPEEVKKRIGYLPETPPLYPEMTVESFLKFILELKKVSKALRKDRLGWALEKCGLKDRRKSVISTLSKGFRQRVGLAQAVIHQPSVIILDEPTVGLDPLQIMEIRDLIQSFRGDHTVLLSTHILSEVTATCERAIIINAGHIVHEQALKDMSEKKSLEEIFLEVISKDSFESNSGGQSLSVA
ncbi:MAG: MFS transporter [Deltaproteobacteria bacterium CG11_big_fil_rev_8_21_14_0_20_45_16]|nr:MAG: MFS transporter [Deltaproteobacteria bacterium CG11_big_fil_rev_8_21_14_0_20_45_16]